MKIPLLSLLVSGIVAWLFFPLRNGLPMVAFFILFASVSSLVYIMRKNRSWFDSVLYGGIVGLSLFLILRANEMVQFITVLFIVICCSFFILPLNHLHSLPTLLLTPVNLVKESLLGKNEYTLTGYKKVGSFVSLLSSLIVTILFVGITLPFLASANPIFNQLLTTILQSLNLSQLVRYFSEEQIIITILRLCFFGFFAYTIPRALSASTKETKIPEVTFSTPITYLIPKVTMGFLLIVFFITQLQLYFASPSVLQSMGYTNARLTNEVFFQVTIVAFIIFFLTYLDNERKTWNKRLTYFLLLEAFFLIGIAFKSVFDYTFLWGLTEKRLWGYATMFWLTGVLLFYVSYYTRQLPLLTFFRQIITYTIVVLFGINLVNFDYRIAHFPHTQAKDGVDYVYLSKLSPDSQSYTETLEKLMMQIESSDKKEYRKIQAAEGLLRRIHLLQQKYKSTIPWNSFNLSEYREYSRIQAIDTEFYLKKLGAFGVIHTEIMNSGL